ncbi:TetR/AcrR family transcriptional regulator C-terminal domain-containing protein [Agromyces sp. NPDC058484]|uniref:TetR/AcrR family transcriptional regulator C-terminal domain-containing protein n=1 Tax=Agromyces sp. NPDC058484 TaxID=3346524 RepID=UPI003662EC03
MLAAGDTPAGELAEPPSGDFTAGLVVLGCAYAELLSRPRIADLIRAVIAESPTFPELRERTFDFGTLPVLAALKRYFLAETAAGTANVDDPDMAATQFLGMIATVVFWPRLVHGNWALTEEETLHVVHEAASTTAARYAAP